jgi:dsDNA-specific endonuclease/ATPase MutS2
VDVSVIEKFGVLAAVAVAMFLQNKSYQDQMRKQVDILSEHAIKREERMATRIDQLENEVRERLEQIIVTQQEVIRDSTIAIRANTEAMSSLRAVLPQTIPGMSH